MLLAAFRLAGFLGKTLDELLDLSWDEFVHWQAFMRLEPPEQAANQRTALLLAQITNMAGRSLKGNKRVSAEDFLGKKQQKQSMADQIAFFKSMSKK